MPFPGANQQLSILIGEVGELLAIVRDLQDRGADTINLQILSLVQQVLTLQNTYFQSINDQLAEIILSVSQPSPTIGLDLTRPVTRTQPVPSKPGP